jgi:hypothetical protein
MPYKRQRTLGYSYEADPVPVYPARQLYKAIPNTEFEIIHGAMTDSATKDTIFTASYPCTIASIKWELSTCGVASGGAYNYAFFYLVHVKEGYTANDPTITDGGDGYIPENNVLEYYSTIIIDSIPMHNTRNVTPNLKMQAGDMIVLVNKLFVTPGEVGHHVSNFQIITTTAHM